MTEETPAPAPATIPLFTDEDAQRIVDAAQAAPLANMEAAAALSKSLAAFRIFYNVATHAFTIVQVPLVPDPPPPPGTPTVN